jgi:hypothetical protein
VTASLVRLLIVLGAAGGALLGAGVALRRALLFRSPAVTVPSALAPGATRDRVGKIWRVRTAGSPEQLGHDHVQLVGDLMRLADDELFTTYHQLVRSSALRWMIGTHIRVRHRHLADDIPAELLREIAAMADTYQRLPGGDPHQAVEPTYQRLVYYHALHDITQGLEHSPLLGCTAFVASGTATRDGHLWVGRNFDFEGARVLGDQRAVLVVRPAGKHGFVHVAWAGMGGVVTGMNDRRVFVALHAARSSAKSDRGIPVALLLRRVLEEADGLDAAVAMLRAAHTMVSNIIVVADGQSGRAVVVEKTPAGTWVRPLPDGGRLGVSNHLESPELARDAANRRLMASTSTVERGQRMNELLSQLGPSGPLDEAAGEALLRDGKLPGGAPLPDGDRRRIDAGIATHAVIADVTAGLLWVAEPPHVSGRFQRFDVLSELGGSGTR